MALSSDFGIRPKMPGIADHPAILELYALRHERLCLSCWLTQIEDWLDENLGAVKLGLG